MNFEGLKYYFNDVDTTTPANVKADVLTLIADAEAATNKKGKRSHNASGVVQVNADTDTEIARFTTQKEALAAIGQPEKKSGISDAVNGRTSTHKAYGYKWYYADEWDAMKENA